MYTEDWINDVSRNSDTDDSSKKDRFKMNAQPENNDEMDNPPAKSVSGLSAVERQQAVKQRTVLLVVLAAMTTRALAGLDRSNQGTDVRSQADSLASALGHGREYGTGYGGS